MSKFKPQADEKKSSSIGVGGQLTRTSMIDVFFRRTKYSVTLYTAHNN